MLLFLDSIWQPSSRLATWSVKMIYGVRKDSQGQNQVSPIHSNLPGKKIYSFFFFFA